MVSHNTAAHKRPKKSLVKGTTGRAIQEHMPGIYDFSGLMEAPKKTYQVTFYDDHIRFDVKISERDWTLTAITDDYERKMFIRLLNCTKNLEYRDVVLKDYLDSFDYLWRNPKYHKQHNDYFEVKEGYLEEMIDNVICHNTSKPYHAIWNELQEMKQAEKKEIELVQKKVKDEKARQQVDTVLMAATMAQMYGKILGNNQNGGRKAN